MKDMQRIIDRCELRTETDIIVLQHFSGLGEPCTYDIEEHFKIDSATGDKTLLYKRRSEQGHIDTDHPLVELYGTGWGTINRIKHVMAVMLDQEVVARSTRMAYISKSNPLYLINRQQHVDGTKGWSFTARITDGKPYGKGYLPTRAAALAALNTYIRAYNNRSRWQRFRGKLPS